MVIMTNSHGNMTEDHTSHSGNTVNSPADSRPTLARTCIVKLLRKEQRVVAAVYILSPTFRTSKPTCTSLHQLHGFISAKGNTHNGLCRCRISSGDYKIPDGLYMLWVCVCPAGCIIAGAM
ncbi:hypothetical protein CUC08_Gglean001836 [Alternaria sp. MG1]|nr:hypothetical protein CUC08_Gglean001836 [Alternaria sp. MG1]